MGKKYAGANQTFVAIPVQLEQVMLIRPQDDRVLQQCPLVKSVLLPESRGLQRITINHHLKPERSRPTEQYVCFIYYNPFNIFQTHLGIINPEFASQVDIRGFLQCVLFQHIVAVNE